MADGQIRRYSDGHIETMNGKRVSRYMNYRGKRYVLVGATDTRRKAENSAAGYRKQFGAAAIKELEPGNYGIYAGGRFGK